MLEKVELYFLDIIKGKRKGAVPAFLKMTLHMLSWGFQFGITCRNWAFDRGFLRRYFPPVPMVVSIGNIVAGGTGKTPVTLMIAQEFYRDFVIAILSRGYRSRVEHLRTPITLCQGNGPIHPATYCGDEPYLLAKNLPKAHVIVGKDRHKASNMAARAGAELILLDDGMQHRHLARDFDVVVMDSLDPFGQGFFLPRGFLRESASSLSRAHLIILNHVEDYPRFEEMREQLKDYTSAPVVGTRMEVLNVWDADGQSADSLSGKKVGVFCGIANPDYFHRTVTGLGAEVVCHETIPDHEGLSIERLTVFAQQCKEQGAERILCTEKDWVKFDSKSILPLPVGWVQMRLKLVAGEGEWNQFISHVKSNLSTRL